MTTLTAVDIATHHEIEQFLFHEAECLDDNRIREWFELLTEDIDYKCPIRVTRERAAGPGFSEEGMHFDEDWGMLEVRVERLETEYAWAEDPPSRTRRLVSNVRPDIVTWPRARASLNSRCPAWFASMMKPRSAPVTSMAESSTSVSTSSSTRPEPSARSPSRSAAI